METHAEYHAQNPLPICGVIFGCMADVIEPPKVGAGRVIKQPMDAPRIAPKADNTKPTNIEAVKARYMSCLSKTKWMTAVEIASILNCNATSVIKTMRRLTCKRLQRSKQTGFGFSGG